jgi:aspartyl/asparaginyl beta-hydroxylase (cupin superfamily)
MPTFEIFFENKVGITNRQIFTESYLAPGPLGPESATVAVRRPDARKHTFEFRFTKLKNNALIHLHTRDQLPVELVDKTA